MKETGLLLHLNRTDSVTLPCILGTVCLPSLSTLRMRFVSWTSLNPEHTYCNSKADMQWMKGQADGLATPTTVLLCPLFKSHSAGISTHALALLPRKGSTGSHLSSTAHVSINFTLILHVKSFLSNRRIVFHCRHQQIFLLGVPQSCSKNPNLPKKKYDPIADGSYLL